MSIGLFIQGPMEEKEAEELAERYRKAGRRVNVTLSFQPGLKLVQVYLPELSIDQRHRESINIKYGDKYAKHSEKHFEYGNAKMAQ
ncbi:hypothetical protein E1B13_21665 [Salmonella enterica subsp. enterica]|nr:hypothetical protein [Salmonella enterica subsp. enterica]